MRAGVFPENSAALARLIGGVVQVRTTNIALDLAGGNAAATLPDDPWAEEGFNFLERQVAEIGGGTTEMARNNIAEKVLKMPREVTHDKNLPFRDVPKGPPAS
jgi:alkylation response protein AidB-like acyl-CoA dehydrogenase